MTIWIQPKMHYTARNFQKCSYLWWYYKALSMDPELLYFRNCRGKTTMFFVSLLFSFVLQWCLYRTNICFKYQSFNFFCTAKYFVWTCVTNIYYSFLYFLNLFFPWNAFVSFLTRLSVSTITLVLSIFKVIILTLTTEM